MAKPIGIRTHRPGADKLAFDNLAIINDEASMGSADSDASPNRPRGRPWEKYAVQEEKKNSTGRKVGKCIGITFMMVALFTLTAVLIIKDKTKAKRMHDYDERMRHTTHEPHNNTKPTTMPPTSAPQNNNINNNTPSPVSYGTTSHKDKPVPSAD